MRDCLRFEKGSGTTSVLLPLLIGLFALTLPACDSGGSMSEEPEDPQDDEVVLSEETVVVDSSEASLQQVEGDTLTFDVTGSDRDFETGSIIAGEQGRGFLRRVKSVEADGNKRVLVTERASLAEAVDQGRLDTTFSLSGPEGETRNMKAVGKAKNVTCGTVAEGIDLDDVSVGSGLGTSDVSLEFTNGSASFDPDIDFDVVIDDGIERFRLAASGDLNFATDVQAGMSGGVEASGGVSLISCQLPTYTILLGKLPVTVTPVLSYEATASVSFEESGTVSTGLESSNSVTLGAEYAAGSWSPISDLSRTLEGRGFETNTDNTYVLQGSVKPELLFKIYYTAGPFINTGPYLRTEADVEPETIDWALLGGLSAGFGGSVEFLDFALAKYEHTFSFAETEITSGTTDRGGDTALNGEALTPSGESLSGMSVTLFGDNQEYSVTTDENGEFSQEVEPGTYEIRGNAVKDKTYLSVNRQQTSVSVQEGETASITLDTEDGYYLDLRDVTLGGDQGTVTASPGESIDLSFDYTAWSRSELSTAIVYAAAGIGEEGQAAANLGIPGSNPGEDGSANITLTAPSETGTYTVYVFEAPQTSESDALSQYENEFPNEHKFIPVATLEVKSGSGGNSDTYAPGNGYEYFVTDTKYDPDTDNISSSVEQEFGSDAELADWSTLVDLYSNDKSGLTSFLDGVGMSKDDDAYLRREGNQYWDGDRHYFIKRHNGDVGSNFLVHDQLHSNTVSLGSWYNSKPALVRIPE